MISKEGLDVKKLPKHIAIIMDGNGRWAKKKGNPRIFGHKKGVEAVRDVVEGAAEIGIDYLTLYTFSTENWNRPRREVDALMSLLVSTVNKEIKTLMENNVRLKSIGDLDNMPSSVAQNLRAGIEKTQKNTGLTLILALSYSSRWEILNAVKNLASDVREEKIDPEDINQDIFEAYLNTSGVPDPELLIRTSGEYRISNYLLWQIAYAELYFTPTLWPDFRRENLFQAIADYQSRERRFGKISEQIAEKINENS